MIRLTLKNGMHLWVMVGAIIALHGLEEGGSLVFLGGTQEGQQFEIQETPQEFLDRTQGRGGVDIPTRKIVAP